MARILLVDDDPNLLNMMGQYCGSNGHWTCEAKDGARAFELFQAHVFDLVITDLQMPVMGGLELTQHIRHLNKHVPIVIISGASVEDIKITEIFLEKPFSMNEFLNIVDSLTQ